MYWNKENIERYNREFELSEIEKDIDNYTSHRLRLGEGDWKKCM